ncbi:MAG: alpha-2-macroglobulin, partial [Bacteroidia bacterium]|nr:alpha-2-macroglobulin [Bacteroidia bacterium]
QLSKNEELKSAILSQTPWVRDALSEEEQMHNIALLFDLVKMAQEREAEKQKLKQRQNQDGGFSWFNGGRSNTYITQYIIEGIGQLNFMDVINSSRDKDLNAIVAKGLNYIDQAAAERYAKLKEAEEEGKIKLKDNHLSSIDIHYLYARSFFETRKMTREAAKAFFYYKDQARKYWVDKNLYEQAMIGLALFAYEEGPQVADIIASMKERALENEELGMYWKFNAGYHWSQLPIETQSLIIQLFHEVEEDKGLIDAMKKWLIKNKQTNRWETTKATASAIQALLKTGTRWIDEAEPVQLHVGKRNISEEVTDKEKGTGYFKTIIAAEDVNATYANISMNNPNNQPSFGAAYFQYWEDMNVIDEYTETPLKLVKTLFKKENTEAGPKLRAISENDPIEIGDLITVRIVLEVDRPMEFVHMKDSRSSGVEPEDVLSAYKWQDGLGYYQTTQDIATNFFFDYLPRGKYVFEYNVRASHEGNFANGITTIQCMYAPSFTSHSEGIQVSIKE